MKKQPDTKWSLDLAGREVLVAICGGIAAYKVCYVVSELVQRGAEVTVVMTEAATRLVTPTTFEALSGRGVLRSMWTSKSAASKSREFGSATVRSANWMSPAGTSWPID